MKRRYPVITAARTRAAADGRSLVSPCTVVITDAASRLAAAAKCRVPGQDRRQDLPGVRSRPGDWRVPQAGYLQEATPDTRGPGDGAAAGPGYAPPPCPPRGSRRIQPGPAHPGQGAPADGRSAAPGRPGRRPGPPRRILPDAASAPLREAPAITAARAGCAGQTLTRARPLRRRAARTARPALVRMRSRNPCVFARRRLFGWNVRLLTGAPDTVHGSENAGAGGQARADSAQAELAPGGPDQCTLRALAGAGQTARAAGRRAAGATTLFAQRAPEPGPRLWTKVRGERAPRAARSPKLSAGGGGAATERETTCTTCGKTC